ncbi:NUDIX hydrolase [Actinoplanes subtropicus]|uniref:NUDIX hydrolase n=1 Tax=Actinoplanes subtropicus TaxID=543632 RepID=UPI0006916ED4|nr:NUDIX domain-containing protein [Actinoplanes subtropicus]
MVRRAREFRGEPAPTRPAATVVLLRPEGQTFQLYVLKRAATMVFGGLHAFPGGGVDPSDRPETIRTDWAELLGVPGEQARAIVGAAARELFEEAGVLLAGPVDELDRTVSDGSLTGVVTHGSEAAGGNGVVGDVSAEDWEEDRAALAARKLTMTELLQRRGLRLRDDLLLPWARWITPEFEPKRFDTWFFVALLPEGQTARDVSGESESATWISPEAANGLAMLPPTRSTVNSLLPYGRIAEVIAAASRRNAASPVMPRVEVKDDGSAVLHVALPSH